MLSKAKIKLIRSLGQKKGRREHQLFVAEGPKVVADLLERGRAGLLVATQQWTEHNAELSRLCDELCMVSPEELSKVSFLQHPQDVLGLFPIPLTADDIHATAHWCHRTEKELVIALDGVQDPGNLGTIIRIADWFGIELIICSHDTADIYNPKVIQATMGSLARVEVVYADLQEVIDGLPAGTPVYGTLLNGDDLYSSELTANGLLVMGNEGNGISEEVARRLTHRLLIPNFPAGRPTADSLNVAIATAVTCAEFRRRLKGNNN